MKLAYRGVEYDYNPLMLEVTKSDLACQYRGHAVQHTYVRHVPIPQPTERLSYRGVAYQTTRQGGIQQLTTPLTGQENGVTTARPTSLGQLRSRLTGNSTAAKARRQLLQESSALHEQSIARTLQHRMDVAKAQGNQALLQQLESEMKQRV